MVRVELGGITYTVPRSTSFTMSHTSGRGTAQVDVELSKATGLLIYVGQYGVDSAPIEGAARPGPARFSGLKLTGSLVDRFPELRGLYAKRLSVTAVLRAEESAYALESGTLPVVLVLAGKIRTTIDGRAGSSSCLPSMARSRSRATLDSRSGASGSSATFASSIAASSEPPSDPCCPRGQPLHAGPGREVGRIGKRGA